MITWATILLILMAALFFGALVGLLPGIPGVVGVLMALPLLSLYSVEYSLLFFGCFICVTQYFGSVSALLFRIPGETSSLPVLEVRQQLRTTTSVLKAYRVTAFTSLGASLVGLGGLVLIFLMNHFTY